MTDNFTSNPAAYLSELQRIEREQELAKLRTLRLEFAGVLDFFPQLREELKAFGNADGIAFDDLSGRLRSTLQQAADLQFDMMDLPAELRDAPEMQAFVQQVKQAMGLQFVGRCTVQFNGICQDIQTRFSQKAEVERKAREKIEAERKAQERSDNERREREAKIQAVIPEMVVIPAGTFTMGCVKGRDDIEHGGWDIEKSEEPAHQVSVARFLLGKYPVTFAQFDAFCDFTGFAKPQDSNRGWYQRSWGRGNRPVVNVSWEDAQCYVAWLSEVTGKIYRLPSEAEWEYAARGGEERYAFPWGQSIDLTKVNCQLNLTCSCGLTTPVGQYPANGFGLYDMHGNVCEWCQDAWHENYQGAPSTGIVWTGGIPASRTVRGGACSSLPFAVRSAARSSNSPDTWHDHIGFRIAAGAF